MTAMSIVQRLNVVVVSMLLLCLCGVSLALWSTRESHRQMHRVELARASYQAHQSLASNTYRLFKQYADVLLLGNDDRDGARELVPLIRADIARIRAIIGREIDLVGTEETEELEPLAAIERKIEQLILSLEALSETSADGGLDRSWYRLSSVLEGDIDGDFQTMIDAALAEEIEEVEETIAAADARLHFNVVLAIAFGVFALLVAALGIAMLRARLARPLGRVLAGVHQLREGDYSHRIALPEDGGEIAALATTVDALAEEVDRERESLASRNVELDRSVRARNRQLENLLEESRRGESNRRRLLADVSHELRTPLTIIQGEADVALRGGEKPPAVYREALERTRDAATHTTSLVDDLLFVARGESGEARLRLEELDLKALLGELTEGPDGSLPLRSTLGSAPLRADPTRLRQAFLVLLQNARQYGGERIELRLERAHDGYLCSVEDDGPGLTDEEKAHVFERFFRGSNAAERYGEGTGLGLPVARAIVRAHGGEITLRDRDGGGLIAEVTLPTRPSLKAVA